MTTEAVFYSSITLNLIGKHGQRRRTPAWLIGLSPTTPVTAWLLAYPQMIPTVYTLFGWIFMTRRKTFSIVAGTASLWSSPENITKKRDARSRPRSVDSDTDDAGNMHVTWEDQGEVWYGRSNGNEWLEPHLLMGASHHPRMPAICIAPNGVVHLAWSGFAFGEDNFCLLLRRLDDDAWSETVKIAENPGSPDGVALAVDKDERVHFAWMDSSLGNVEIFHRQGLPDELNDSVSVEPLDAKGFTYRGGFWLETGELDKALEDYTEATRRDPTYAHAYLNRATTWMRRGDLDAAIRDYSTAIRLEPTDDRFYFNRGLAWQEKQAWGKAIQDFLEAIKYNPERASTYRTLGWVFATCPDARYRDGSRAIKYATKACQMDEWKTPTYLGTLAAAYAELGEFDKAVEWQTKARDMDPEPTAQQELLDLFKAEKPYRQDI